MQQSCCTATNERPRVAKLCNCRQSVMGPTQAGIAELQSYSQRDSQVSSVRTAGVDQYVRQADTLASLFLGNRDQGNRRGARGGCAPSASGRRYRTVFVSDVHLGTRGCEADALAAFLASTPCDKLFLVGDIIDGWRLTRRWYWPEAHTAVLHEILRKVDGGTRVIYVPGNHDEAFRDFCGRALAGIEIAREAVHETADGKHFLVIHGDQFDGVIACAKWLAHLGDWAYTLVLRLSDAHSAMRRRFGLPYWSLSAY